MVMVLVILAYRRLDCGCLCWCCCRLLLFVVMLLNEEKLGERRGRARHGPLLQQCQHCRRVPAIFWRPQAKQHPDRRARGIPAGPARRPYCSTAAGRAAALWPARVRETRAREPTPTGAAGETPLRWISKQRLSTLCNTKFFFLFSSPQVITSIGALRSPVLLYLAAAPI